MKHLSNTTLNLYQVYFFPRFEPVLLTSFSWPSLAAASLPSASRWFSSLASFFLWLRLRAGFLLHQSLNLMSLQVSWIQSHKVIRNSSKWIPWNDIFKFSEVWRKQRKSCIYNWPCRNMYSIGWLAQNFSESGKWNVESGKRKVESEIFWLAGFWNVIFGK